MPTFLCLAFSLLRVGTGWSEVRKRLPLLLRQHKNSVHSAIKTMKRTPDVMWEPRDYIQFIWGIYIYILTQWPDKEIIAFLLVEHRPLLVPLLPTSLSPPPCLLPLNYVHISCLLMLTSIPCTNKDKQLLECIIKRRREVVIIILSKYIPIYVVVKMKWTLGWCMLCTVGFHNVQHLDGGNGSKMRWRDKSDARPYWVIESSERESERDWSRYHASDIDCRGGSILPPRIYTRCHSCFVFRLVV